MTPPSAAIEALIAAIAELPPEQRRQLQRRLHATGVFVAEDLLTDKNRLGVAIAVRDSETPGAVRARQHSIFDEQPVSSEAPEPKRAARNKQTHANQSAHLPVNTSTGGTKPTVPAPTLPAQQTGGRTTPAPGRVVVGTPQSNDPHPHEMTPLPGQAPEAPITIVFDGGSKGNPGEGYGSYQLGWPGTQPQLVRLQFGSNYTNNEAEYDTLIRALEDVHRRLQQAGAAPKSARVEVRGDSQLVIRQVLGEWKCKDARMAQRRDQVRRLLTPLGSWTLHWHDRSNSVRALGH